MPGPMDGKARMDRTGNHSASTRHMPDERTDETLLSGIAAGDMRSLRTLSDRHSGKIFALSYRMLGSADEADEVAQEALIRIWKNAGGWEPGRAAFTTWLHRVVTNLCLDRLRRRKGGAELDEALLPPVEPIAEERIAGQELGAIMAEGIASLPDRQRAALVLFHYEELSVSEIAAVLETTVASVESLLARARRSLKQRLRPDLLEGGFAARNSKPEGNAANRKPVMLEAGAWRRSDP